MNGLYFIPILSVMVMGLLSKRVPAWSANLALVMGFVLIALGYFVPALAEKVAQMHEFHFGSCLCPFVGDHGFEPLIKPMDQPWEHHHSGDVDLMPWQWAKPMGIGLAVAVLLLYMAFAIPASFEEGFGKLPAWPLNAKLSLSKFSSTLTEGGGPKTTLFFTMV